MVTISTKRRRAPVTHVIRVNGRNIPVVVSTLPSRRPRRRR
jgi:hypothetical protein